MIQFDELQNLLQADSQARWLSCLLNLTQDLGFQHVLFGMVPNKVAPLESAFLASNYPSEWRSTYDRQHMHHVDPTVSHCRTSTLPLIWTPEIFQGPERSEFYEQACGFGLRSGISFPMHGTLNELGMLSFVADDQQHAAHGGHLAALSALSLLRDYTLESAQKFVQRTFNPAAQVKLTGSELECLKWVAAGKTSWEVARILSRSEATINFHLANIKRKFDVQTRQQAVVRAIRMGILALA